MTLDSLTWTRPEDITAARPFYYVAVANGASDLVGSLVGAFAAAAPLFKSIDPVYYAQLLSMAQALYGIMISALRSTPLPLPRTLKLKPDTSILSVFLQNSSMLILYGD